MLPQFDVEVKVEKINPDQLRVIWIDEVGEDGIGDNRMYVDLTGAEWSEVQSAIEAEEKLINDVAARAAGADDFDRLLDETMNAQYPGEDFDEGPLSAFALLDPGVISAVAALSAAGCISTTSCRGHRTTGEPSPLVRFVADDQRLPFIRDAASSGDCGLLLDSAGMLQLYARNVLAFVAFAKALLERREAIEAIKSHVVCARPEDAYLDDQGEDVRRRDLAIIQVRIDAERVVQCDGQLSLLDDER